MSFRSSYFRQNLQIKSKHKFHIQTTPPPFFKKIVLFMRYVQKYSTAGQATDDSVANAHFMLDT